MDDHSPDDATLIDRFRAAQLRRPEGALPPSGEPTGGTAGLTPAVVAPFVPTSATTIDLDVIPAEVQQIFIVETTDDLHDLRR